MRRSAAISVSSLSTRCARSPSARRGRRGEREADLVAMAPFHPRADRLFLLRDVELDDVGHVHRAREDDARAGLGEVADEAIHRAAALVEIDAAAQEALLARGVTAFGHGGVLD